VRAIRTRRVVSRSRSNPSNQEIARVAQTIDRNRAENRAPPAPFSVAIWSATLTRLIQEILVVSREGSAPSAPAVPPSAHEDPRLPAAARRALVEAEARRSAAVAARTREFNGRGGLDPTRYGDWEVKGLASDF
jgi:hypothetical protein